MKLKSIIIGMIFSVVSFVFVNTANAAVNWEPLVKIPGIPVTGVNLSTYLIGIYNFLLSIVGIVAVMMLIVGGMRYITAAGNSAAIADAKDIITNAIVGLLLALLTWVFIATINPDALYLKKPGSTFSTALPVGPDAGACYNNFVLPDVCTCGDGAVITSSNVGDCLSDCRTQGHCIIPPGSCIRKGANNFGEGDDDGTCYCIDGTDVIPDPLWLAGPPLPLPTELNCDFVCTNPDAAYGNYHGMNWDLRVGNDLGNLSSGKTFTVDGGSPVFFDLSRVRDCKGRTVHLAVDYDGAPAWNGLAVDNYCCLINNPGCGLVWAAVCDAIGVSAFMCNSPEHLNEGRNALIDLAGAPTPVHIYFPEPTDDSYPVYKHVYPGGVVENFWVGVSYLDSLGVCTELQEVFIVTSAN